jgi:lipid II:glycine glycyltransferase (peptidoglycan interpeptide bridge formation enzyme)
VRRAIRKGERENVRVEIRSTEEAMRDFYRLHCYTRRKHGLPPQSFTFFQNIYQYIIARGLGFVCLARWFGQPISGAIFMHVGKRALYKYGASDIQYQAMRGNNLVMWEAIKFYGLHGYKTLHFGRTDVPAEGLRRFKCGWGASERLIEYVRYDYGTGKFVGRETETQEQSNWSNVVFRTMPVGVGRLVGKLAYRHMA